MKVLGIETSSARGSVALVDDGALLGELTHDAANRHAEELVPLLDRLLADAKLPRERLQLIAVGLGPGSFTGLRVGIALASGIALGLGIPLVGVPSLVALAHGLQLDHALPATNDTDPEWLGALTDARRGEYFFAAFNRRLEPVVDTCLLAYDQVGARLETLLATRSVWIAGSAAREAVPSRWLPVAKTSREERLASSPHAQFPSATSVALLSQSRHATGDVSPLYFRDADAKRPTLPPNPI